MHIIKHTCFKKNLFLNKINFFCLTQRKLKCLLLFNNTGCQLSWLEYLPVTQGVASSSLVHPAANEKRPELSGLFLCLNLSNHYFFREITFSTVINSLSADSLQPLEINQTVSAYHFNFSPDNFSMILLPRSSETFSIV